MLHICTHVQPSYSLRVNPVEVLESAIQGLRLAFKFTEVPSYDELLALDQLSKVNDVMAVVDPAEEPIIEMLNIWIATIDNNDPIT